MNGNLFVPKTPEPFTYDDDGNLLSDGRWNYTWDGENRLVRMVAKNTSPPVGPQQRIDFYYDYKGRRIGKKVWNNIAGNDPPELDQKFVYDGDAARRAQLLAAFDRAVYRLPPACQQQLNYTTFCAWRQRRDKTPRPAFVYQSTEAHPTKGRSFRAVSRVFRPLFGVRAARQS